jgi:hypothetical protein
MALRLITKAKNTSEGNFSELTCLLLLSQKMIITRGKNGNTSDRPRGNGTCSFSEWLMTFARCYPMLGMDGTFDFATKFRADGDDRLMSVFNVSFSKG